MNVSSIPNRFTRAAPFPEIFLVFYHGRRKNASKVRQGKEIGQKKAVGIADDRMQRNSTLSLPHQ